jgi:hypothetical protein
LIKAYIFRKADMQARSTKKGKKEGEAERSRTKKKDGVGSEGPSQQGDLNRRISLEKEP